MRAFWDDSTGNFGDVLGPFLLDRLAGITLEWSRPEEAEIFAIGSIAEAIPPGYRGWILGTGKMFATTPLDLRWSRCLALRGPLTLEGARLNEPPAVLADLGLLAADVLPADAERGLDDVGVIPHYADRRRLGRGIRIEVRWPPDRVIRAAARCSRIVTSSLHGLVLADALGIPSTWRPSPAVLGDGFKFRDYAASYGEVIRPGVPRLAPPVLVAAKQAALRDLLGQIA